MNKFIDYIDLSSPLSEEPGTTSADIAQVDKKLDLSKDTKLKKICEACTEDTKCDECQLAEDLEDLEKLKIKT